MGGVGVQLEGIKAAPHNPSLCFLGVWFIERGVPTEPVVETGHTQGLRINSQVQGYISMGVLRGTALRYRATPTCVCMCICVLGRQ